MVSSQLLGLQRSVHGILYTKKCARHTIHKEVIPHYKSRQKKSSGELVDQIGGLHDQSIPEECLGSDSFRYFSRKV